MKLTQLSHNDIVCLMKNNDQFFMTAEWAISWVQQYKHNKSLKVYTAKTASKGRVQCKLRDYKYMFRIHENIVNAVPSQLKGITKQQEEDLIDKISDWLVDNDFAYEKGSLLLDISDIKPFSTKDTVCVR